MGEINSYKLEQDNLEKQADIANTDLTKLEERLKGVSSVDELKHEVDVFLEKNDVPTDVEAELKRRTDNFTENTGVLYARSVLEEYLEKEASQKETELEKNKEEMLDKITDEISPAAKELEFLGIDPLDSFKIAEEAVKNNIDDTGLNKIIDNIDFASNSLRERINIYGEMQPNTIITEEQIASTMNNSGVETLNDTIVEQETNNYNDMVNDNMIYFAENGSIIIQGDFNVDPQMNFISKVVNDLVVENNDYNLDMSLFKTSLQTDSYSVSLKPESYNFSDSEIVALRQKICSVVNGYNKNIDTYNDTLAINSPQLASAISLMALSLKEQNGEFRFDYRNSDQSMDFMMNINYYDLANSFAANGAVLEEVSGENFRVSLSSLDKQQQFEVLNNTYRDQVKLQKEKSKEKELEQENSMQKKYGEIKYNSANVSGSVLIMVVLAEIIALTAGAFIIFR